MSQFKNYLKDFPVLLDQNRREGRHIKASRRIERTEVVLKETATAFVVLYSERKNYCQYCLARIRPLDDSVSCLLCKNLSYWCCNECKKSDKIHNAACNYLGSLSGIAGSSSVDFNLLRLLVVILVKSSNDSIRGTSFNCFNSLLSHIKSFESVFKESLLQASIDFISEFQDRMIADRLERFTANALVKIACRINSNSHAVHDPTGHTNQPIGVGVFPLVALFNHSCSPNAAYITTASGDMVVKATKTIEMGEQIFVSYIDLYAPRWERQGKLLITKHFLCECSRCTSEKEGDLLLEAFKCVGQDCEGWMLPRDSSHFTCSYCQIIASNDQAISVLNRLKVDEAMEIAKVSPDSALICLEKSLDHAVSILHPGHGLILTIQVNLLNLYSKTNQLANALLMNRRAIQQMKAISLNSNLSELNPELGNLYEKYLELLAVCSEAVAQGMMVIPEWTLSRLKEEEQEISKKSELTKI